MRFLIRCFMVLFTASFMLFSNVGHASVAEFKKVHGVVDVFREGERKATPVAVGGVVNVGDIIRTARRSRAQLKFADGSVLNLGSLTKIKIGEFTFSAEKKVRKSNIRNLRGKVRAAVSKVENKDSYFRIQTPGAVAAVRGTNFGVNVISPEVTEVLTFEGAVAVSSLTGSQRHNTVLVLANHVTRVVTGQTPSAPVMASPKAIGSMVEATKQFENSDSGDGAKGEGSKGNGAMGRGTKSDGTTGTGGTASTTTKTTGAVTSEGVKTTTTTTTTTTTGKKTTMITSTSAGAAPMAAPVTALPLTAGLVPVIKAPVIAPVIATPPITTTIPAVQNANVNVVILF
ncbi:MAG: FecR family protein [Mariprofundus sp.]|nr:FecR family protein [Mariprofundus sp.]